jgi:hypothetical protein
MRPSKIEIILAILAISIVLGLMFVPLRKAASMASSPARSVGGTHGYGTHIIEFDHKGRHHAYVVYVGGSGVGISRIGEYDITKEKP